MASVLRALASVFSTQVSDTIRENDKFLLPKLEGTPLLDSLALSFLQNINNLLAVGVLARTRRAVLLNWKVLDLSSLNLLLVIITFGNHTVCNNTLKLDFGMIEYKMDIVF